MEGESRPALAIKGQVKRSDRMLLPSNASIHCDTDSRRKERHVMKGKPTCAAVASAFVCVCLTSRLRIPLPHVSLCLSSSRGSACWHEAVAWNCIPCLIFARLSAPFAVSPSGLASLSLTCSPDPRCFISCSRSDGKNVSPPRVPVCV